MINITRSMCFVLSTLRRQHFSSLHSHSNRKIWDSVYKVEDRFLSKLESNCICFGWQIFLNEMNMGLRTNIYLVYEINLKLGETNFVLICYWIKFLMKFGKLKLRRNVFIISSFARHPCVLFHRFTNLLFFIPKKFLYCCECFFMVFGKNINFHTKFSTFLKQSEIMKRISPFSHPTKMIIIMDFFVVSQA